MAFIEGKNKMKIDFKIKSNVPTYTQYMRVGFAPFCFGFSYVLNSVQFRLNVRTHPEQSDIHFPSLIPVGMM